MTSVFHNQTDNSINIALSQNKAIQGNLQQLSLNISSGTSGIPNNVPLSPTILATLMDELGHILKTMPKNWDEGARLLALARPIIETVALCGGYFPLEEIRDPGKRGPVPSSRVSLLEIEIIAHLWFLGNYTNAVRVIGEHPTWLKALQLLKVPDHTTLCHFRKLLGVDFFKRFFTQMTKILIAFGLLPSDTPLVVDSLPIHANMNFARANVSPTLDEPQLIALFLQLNLSPVEKVLEASGINLTRDRKYPIQSLIRIILLEWIGGFISRSQVLKFLKKHDQIAEVIGSKNNAIPPDATLTTFLKSAPSPENILRLLRPQLISFFRLEAVAAEQDDPYFFLVNCGKVNLAPTLMPGLAIAQQKNWHF